MYYLKIEDQLFPAEFTGKLVDKDWDGRASKTITTELSYDLVKDLFHDDMEWHIYKPMQTTRQAIDTDGNPVWQDGEVIMDDEGNLIKDEDGNIQHHQEPVMEEVDISEDFDNSEYSVLGDIVVHPDGTISIKMGKPTELEEAYTILYGGM